MFASHFLFTSRASAQDPVINNTLIAVQTYDAATNANAVDTNANGNPLTATGLTDVAGFTLAVSDAFLLNFGGVINFDTGFSTSQIASGASPGFSVNYGSGSKFFDVTTSRAVRTTQYGSATAISSSGTPASQFDLLGTDENLQTLVVSFGAISGGISGEVIKTIGFTALSRNGVTPTLSMTATFSNNATATLSDSLTGTAAADDTFYGFTAPSGLSISSLSITRSVRVPFDDLGFITAVVPEPTSGLLLLGGLALVGARRVRRV